LGGGKGAPYDGYTGAAQAKISAGLRGSTFRTSQTQAGFNIPGHLRSNDNRLTRRLRDREHWKWGLGYPGSRAGTGSECVSPDRGHQRAARGDRSLHRHAFRDQLFGKETGDLPLLQAKGSPRPAVASAERAISQPLTT